MSGREIYVRMELRSHICRDCLRALMGFECAWQGGGTIISEPLGEVKSKLVGFSLTTKARSKPITAGTKSISRTVRKRILGTTIQI